MDCIVIDSENVKGEKMPIFSEMFEQTENDFIDYNGKKIIQSDKIKSFSNFKITLKLLSANSRWKQAVAIKINTGSMTVDNVIKGKYFRFWEDDLKSEPENTIVIHGKTKDNFISVWNACEVINSTPYSSSKCIEAWTMGCAMIKGENGVYYCNDFDPDDDFNDLIFQIKVEEQ